MNGLIDIHCHILPGVDDGASDMQEVKRLLMMAYRNKVAGIIVTPHYRVGIFETPQEVIEERFVQVKNAVQHADMGLRIYLGCEFHCNSHMVKDLKQKKRPTLAGSKYVLVEFSSMHGYSTIRKQVYDLVAAGYQPIIAHIERYECILHDLERVIELIELGAEVQITADAVLGGDGRRVKRFCKRLLKRRWVNYIASDAHDSKRRPLNLKRCADYVAKKYGEAYAQEIFIKNPTRIIKGEQENESS